VVQKLAGLFAPKKQWDDQVRRELGVLFGRRALIFILVFLALAILFDILSGGVFISSRNLSLLLRQGAILAVLAGGVAMLIIMAEIDLSIGSAVFLCGLVAAKLSVDGNLPLLAIVLITVLAGMAIGAIQGLWVVWLGIPSFVATLAGLLAYRGIGLLWTDASAVGPVPADFTALSESFLSKPLSVALLSVIFVLAVVALVFGVRRLRQSAQLRTSNPLPGGQATAWFVGKTAAVGVPLALIAWIVLGFEGLPMALIWVGAVIAVLIFLMNRTVFGRNAFLVGSSRESALYAGINVKKTVFAGFVIMGALYGIAGVLMTARLGNSTPGLGQFLELDAIAAAVIGGVSLRGGAGSIVGAVMGAFLLTTINNGMSILNVPSFAQLVIKAIILLLALAFDAQVAKNRR
jgi:D-xylose transport system permease protein